MAVGMSDEMADVSHTPPEGEDVGNVWERGHEAEE